MTRAAFNPGGRAQSPGAHTGVCLSARSSARPHSGCHDLRSPLGPSASSLCLLLLKKGSSFRARCCQDSLWPPRSAAPGPQRCTSPSLEARSPPSRKPSSKSETSQSGFHRSVAIAHPQGFAVNVYQKAMNLIQLFFKKISLPMNQYQSFAVMFQNRLRI